LILNGVQTYDIAYFNWQNLYITIRLRSGTKAQSGSDPAKLGQNPAPIRLRIRSMLISGSLTPVLCVNINSGAKLSKKLGGQNLIT